MSNKKLAGIIVACTIAIIVATVIVATQGRPAPTQAAPDSDLDGDGLTYAQESQLGTDPDSPDFVLKYALDRGLPKPMAEELNVLDEDGKMDDNERTFVDYLQYLETFVPGETRHYYTNEEIRSIQENLIGSVLSDCQVSGVEAEAMTCLKNQKWYVQRDIIDSGMIDDRCLGQDWDGDGYINIMELNQGTNPLNDLETDPNNPSERYAVIASGVNCYGCSANTMEMYHLLKKNGYDDNHIVLLVNHHFQDSIYPDEDSDWDRDNEWRDKDLLHDLGPVVMDYENSEVTTKSFLEAIVNLPTDGNDEVMVYYTGHGCGSSKAGDAAFALSSGFDSVLEAGSGLEPGEKWHGFWLQGGWLRHYMLNEAIRNLEYGRLVVMQDGCATGEMLKDLDKTDSDEDFGTGVQANPIENTLAIGSSWWAEELPEGHSYHFRGWGHYLVNALKVEGSSIMDAVDTTRMAQDPIVFYFDKDTKPVFDYDHTQPAAKCPWFSSYSPVQYINKL